MTAIGPGLAPSLVAFMAYLVVERGAELVISSRNGRRLSALGARRHPNDGMPLLVAVHVFFPVALLADVLLLGARPGPGWPVWFGIWIAAQILRAASVHALGVRWHVRVITLPGVPPVRSGPYRWWRHPNYAAVVAELIAGAMMFGAWRTMIAVTAINGVALVRRIRVENEALRG